MIWLVRYGCSEQHEQQAVSDRGQTVKHGFRLRSTEGSEKGLCSQDGHMSMCITTKIIGSELKSARLGG